MRRLEVGDWAALVMLVVCVAITAPMPFLWDGAVAPAVPRVVWIAVALVLFASLLGVAFVPPASRARTVLVGVQVAASCTMVLTAPGASGFLLILLVVVAAVSVWFTDARVTWAVVAVNTVVVGVVKVIGSAGPLDVVFSTLIYLALQVAAVLSALALVRERWLRVQLIQAHTELRAAAVLAEESSRAAERLRISRELHDVLGHQLTVLALELEAASHLGADEAADHVRRARAVARELLGDVRDTVSELRRRAPDLADALGQVAGAVTAPQVLLSVSDDVVAGEAQTAALVRVVQEVVTNAVRHSEARTLHLRVASRGGLIVLDAHDDGHGMAQVRPGNGLRGIVERVEALGGSVRFDGTRGFRVDVRLPAGTAS